MSKLLRTCLYTAALAALPTTLMAQVTTAAPGERVRVTLTKEASGRSGTPTIDAILRGTTRDSLQLDPLGAGEYLAVPRADVAVLERHAGSTGNAGKGALIGGGIGLGVGLLLAVLVEAEDCDGLGCPTQGSGFLIPVLTVPLGAGVGALIGAGSKRDRWERVEAPAVSVAPLVGRDRVGLAMQVRF